MEGWRTAIIVVAAAAGRQRQCWIGVLQTHAQTGHKTLHLSCQLCRLPCWWGGTSANCKPSQPMTYQTNPTDMSAPPPLSTHKYPPNSSPLSPSHPPARAPDPAPQAAGLAPGPTAQGAAANTAVATHAAGCHAAARREHAAQGQLTEVDVVLEALLYCVGLCCGGCVSHVSKL